MNVSVDWSQVPPLVLGLLFGYPLGMWRNESRRARQAAERAARDAQEAREIVENEYRPDSDS